MNLLMIAPLCDSRGLIRYFIGAQVDISGLVKECTELESFHRLMVEQRYGEYSSNQRNGAEDVAKTDEFQELSEMFNIRELSTVKRWGGRMHREHQDEDMEGDSMSGAHKPRLLLREPSPDLNKTSNLNGGGGKLSGVYQHVSSRILSSGFLTVKLI